MTVLGFTPFELGSAIPIEAAQGVSYGEGWHLDSQPVWSAEKDAILYFDPKVYPVPIFGILRLFIYGQAQLKLKALTVDSAGQAEISLQIPSDGLVDIVIKTPKPASVPKSATAKLQLTLSLAQIISPAEAVGSADQRRLGLQVVSFTPEAAARGRAGSLGLRRLRHQLRMICQSKPMLNRLYLRLAKARSVLARARASK